MVVFVNTADQHRGRESPGTLRVLSAKHTHIYMLFPAKHLDICLCEMQTERDVYLDWISACRDISDHIATAPPIGCVGIAGMNQKSVMDLNPEANLN